MDFSLRTHVCAFRLSTFGYHNNKDIIVTHHIVIIRWDQKTPFLHFRESFLRLAASRFHRFSDVDTVLYLSLCLSDSSYYYNPLGSGHRFHFRESFLRLAASRFNRFSDVDTVFYLSFYRHSFSMLIPIRRSIYRPDAQSIYLSYGILSIYLSLTFE